VNERGELIESYRKIIRQLLQCNMSRNSVIVHLQLPSFEGIGHMGQTVVVPYTNDLGDQSDQGTAKSYGVPPFPFKNLAPVAQMHTRFYRLQDRLNIITVFIFS